MPWDGQYDTSPPLTTSSCSNNRTFVWFTQSYIRDAMKSAATGYAPCFSEEDVFLLRKGEEESALPLENAIRVGLSPDPMLNFGRLLRSYMFALGDFARTVHLKLTGRKLSFHKTIKAGYLLMPANSLTYSESTSSCADKRDLCAGVSRLPRPRQRGVTSPRSPRRAFTTSNPRPREARHNSQSQNDILPAGPLLPPSWPRPHPPHSSGGESLYGQRTNSNTSISSV